MRIVSVLVAVDTENALASGDLQNNVYLMDNNKYMGSYGEGTSELVTEINDGQLIKWKVTSIVPENQVQIVNFFGQAPNEGVIRPVKQGFGGESVWEARVEARGQAGTYQYSMTLSFDGREMAFDPFLRVVE